MTRPAVLALAGPGPASTRPALLALAHGSRDPRAAATVAALLARVRARRPGLAVAAAFLDHARPGVPEAVDALAAAGHREVCAVPLLLTHAYHGRVDVPRVLAAAQARHPRLRLAQADVLGGHPALLAALERRLREVGVWPGDPRVTVVLAAAGSSDASANAGVADLARRWQAAGWRAVVPAYLSMAEPTPAQAVRALRAGGATRVAVASYLVAPGRFQDLLGAAGADVVSDPLGPADELARAALDRFDVATTASATGLRVARSA